MHYLTKAAGAAALIGIIAGATIVLRHEKPIASAQPVPVAVDGAESCNRDTEACDTHRPNAAKAGARLEGRPRMIAFSSAACPACERMKPRLAEAIKACRGEADVYRVNVDDDAGETLAATYNVSLLPTYVNVDASGVEVSRLTGVQSEERLERSIEEVRAVQCASIEKKTDEKPM
ncbi:thioredoxin family protein [Pendulispora brunnea]|uniref:Thioredoxin family protein n=1 Tax=Pendulispora brunnea TaxID=2905690 RepID=A0ABZ2KNF9_9BACT